MARYRDDFDDRSYYERRDRPERERPWNFNSPPEENRRSEEYRSERFGRGRFGERALHEADEPRYGGYSQRQRDEEYNRSAEYDRDYGTGRREYYAPTRSRLRCRDIMTRDLVVATRDTTLVELALMMKEEDTGVIPIVEHQVNGGNGGVDSQPTRTGFGYGKLIGLVTDRDIVVRTVADGKDCLTARAEEIMSTDILSARPNDRVVDVLRKMGEKQVRRIPVASENGTLRGMISIGDIARETDADQELADALEEISKESSFWGRIFS